MSPPGMVRVRHFEFLCRSHGIEPTVERFWVFYQLIRNMGFYSFASRGAAKKILLNPPKSFHDWKPKFFFIRKEVIPIAMTFRAWSEPIVKEDLPIPKQETWYVKLTSTPNRVFGENVLVAAGMSDQWAPDSKYVPVLKFQDRGVRPLKAGEEYWYDQIKGHFMYPVADAFAGPPIATEGMLLDLGIDPEEKKKKPKKKKVITIDADVTSKKGGSSRATTGVADKGTLRLRQSNLEDYVIISDSFEGLSHIGEKKSGAAGSKSSGSVGSRNPDAGATLSSVAHEEEEKEDEVEEEGPDVQLIRKRSREAAFGAFVMSKPGGVPLIGKKSNLRSLYRFSPEAKKKTPEKKGVVITEPSEPALKRPKVTIKPLKATESEKETPAHVEKEIERKRAVDKPLTKPNEPEVVAATLPEKAQGPEVAQVTGLDQPVHDKREEPEVEKLVQTTRVTPTGEGSGSGSQKDQFVAAGGSSTGFAAGQTGAGGSWRCSAPSALGLKQKDTFLEFAPCRDWFLNSFPPGEVNRQRARTYNGLYHAYFVGEANTRAANHQIVREWRTMVMEREEWEKYRELLLKHVKDFEKPKAAFDEEKAKFESDMKPEEWGREGLRGKLCAAEELLAKERAEWKKICAKDNERMYAARAKINDLECQVSELKGKVEDAQAAKEEAEAELKATISSKDKDLAAKDVEIAELKRRLQEQVDKRESLEIDLEADKGKVASAEEARQEAEEARNVSTAALNVGQNNYSEVQGVVDTLAAEAEWMRGRGVCLIANSILNAGELDGTVAALIDASRAVGHRGGYLECAQHVEEVFGQTFDSGHCSVTDQADAKLARAEKAYDHLSLPIMDLIMDALKHDDWSQRLKSLLDPPETVELSDEEEPAGDDEGGNDGDDDKHDDDGDDNE
ncbi:hypothetical protein Hanom_Chr01g00047181 [Helianthus anomalus]